VTGAGHASRDLPAAPAVDVVIATRDRPEMLRAAVDSVLGQDYPGPITCVVVFDRTEPDPSLELTDGDRRVVVVRNHRTPGLAGARNAGILHGSGDLVAFLDDDDLWAPEKVRRQVGALTRTGADTSLTGIVIRYADHETIRVPVPGDLTLEQLVRRRVVEAHPSSVMVRRASLLGPIGLVDEEIPGSFGEDYDWLLRAARAGRFAVVADPLVTVRWGASMFSQRWQTIIEALDYLLRKHPEFAQDRKALARLRGQRAFALAALGRSREALDAAWRTFRTAPTERRAYVATVVALRLLSARRVMDLAHRHGRGI
jgi:glycosyltransferase involved in cell wall biosynthesis